MDDQTLLRYSRQIMLPEVEIEGQEKLLRARVLIIGMGGLGAPAAMYLAAAGVGHLVINDFDRVDLSNLQRQIVHTTADIGRPKVESARETLLALNPQIEVTALDSRLEEEALLAQVRLADVVVDACDNLATRFAINAACVRSGRPLVSGAAIRLEGQVLVYDPRRADAPCYRCLYRSERELEERCSQTGVLAPIVGVIGSLQAVEAIKLIVGCGAPSAGRLLLFDGRGMEFQEVRVPRNPACPVCGAGAA
ncbi:MAG TPA: molybdopterin-synthase adenylyltransferase MoeB [Candidatus Competibacteraceae bacterium]|nr:molybdopterin-synthase adenylyltransferase MoeB [Candidatus Competibacteraceae bacterium]